MKSKTKAMLMSLGAMALVAMLGGQAHAVTADTFQSSSTPPNSSASPGGTEELLLEAACGCSLTLVTQINTNDSGVLHDGLVNYIDVAPNEPGVFLLKFGVGKTGSPTHYMFLNDAPGVGEMTKLAWTDAQLTAAGLVDRHLNSISHYTYGGSASVPEPASLLLLGAGLAALGIWRRKQA